MLTRRAALALGATLAVTGCARQPTGATMPTSATGSTDPTSSTTASPTPRERWWEGETFRFATPATLTEVEEDVLVEAWADALSLATEPTRGLLGPASLTLLTSTGTPPTMLVVEQEHRDRLMGANELLDAVIGLNPRDLRTGTGRSALGRGRIVTFRLEKASRLYMARMCLKVASADAVVMTVGARKRRSVTKLTDTVLHTLSAA